MDSEGVRWSDSAIFDLSPNGMALWYGELSPDGRYLALQLASPLGGDIQVSIVERVTGEVVQWSAQMSVTPKGSFLGWLPDGRFIFRQYNDIEIEDVPTAGILLVDPQTSQYSLLDLPVDPERGICIAGSLSLSPDGDMLAYSARGLENGARSVGIWTMHIDGSNKKEIFHIKGTIDSLSWSPNGNKIIFIYQAASNQMLPGGLWILNSDGSDAKLLADGIPNPGEQRSRPAWSPDGRYVAFAQYDQPTTRDGTYVVLALSNVYVVDTITGEITRLSSFEQREVSYPTWSQDGSFIAFVSTGREGEDTLWSEVWVTRADASQLYPVAESARWWNALLWLPPASSAEGR